MLRILEFSIENEIPVQFFGLDREAVIGFGFADLMSNQHTIGNRPHPALLRYSPAAKIDAVEDGSKTDVRRSDGAGIWPLACKGVAGCRRSRVIRAHPKKVQSEINRERYAHHQ